MNINPDIFRAYDIRGIYPQDINEETSFYIGKAFIEFLKKIGMDLPEVIDVVKNYQ